MSRIHRYSKFLCFSLLGLTIAAPAMANDPDARRSLDIILDNTLKTPQTEQSVNSKISQVNSVSQLSDVRPTDWAFTSLQSLVERYGCISGYPDRKFRGQQALSRYEFAAGLNACSDKINEIISAGLADKVGKEDLATLKNYRKNLPPN